MVRSALPRAGAAGAGEVKVSEHRASQAAHPPPALHVFA